MSRTQRIAIVGGGIGGLSAAFYFHGRQAEDGTIFECTVLDRAERLGGNAFSAYGEPPLQPPFGDIGACRIQDESAVEAGERPIFPILLVK